MRQRSTAFAAAVLFAAAIAGQAQQVDDYISAEMKRQRIPGLALAVVKDGTIVKAQGYGVSNLKLATPVTPETVFKIGSVSKQFIATGIMLLVQDGRLSLDDRVSMFLEGTPETWKAITVRHLLTHTSGIVREAPGFAPMKVQSDADVIKSAYPLPLRFAPGEKWEYSNTGYFALAEIIRKVAGMPWQAFLHQKVFAPAGLNATHPTDTKAHVPGRALGYSDNDLLKDADDWTALRPSGAFLSTVLDLAKWDAVLYTDAILRHATRSQMWSPVMLNDGTTHRYGLGWEIDSFKGRRQVHHGGGIPGFQSEFARYVDDRLTVIVLINLDDADVQGIAEGVAALYLAPAY